MDAYTESNVCLVLASFGLCQALVCWWVQGPLVLADVPYTMCCAMRNPLQWLGRTVFRGAVVYGNTAQGQKKKLYCRLAAHCAFSVLGILLRMLRSYAVQS